MSARFCSKCGAALDRGARFCAGCGAGVPTAAAAPPLAETRDETPAPAPGRRRRWPIAAAAFAVVAAAVGGAWFLSRSDDEPPAGPETADTLVTTLAPGIGTTSVSAAASPVGVVESVMPDEALLVVSSELGVVPANLIDVALEVGRPAADAAAVASAVGGTVVGSLGSLDMYQIQIAATTEAELVAALEVARTQPSVVMAVADIALYPDQAVCESRSVLGSDSYSEGDNARPVEMVGVEEAWAIIRASQVEMRGAHVAVIESGPAQTWSSEVEGGVISGDMSGHVQPLHFANGKPDPARGLTHPTRVAHVIGARSDNGGTTGFAAVPGGGITVAVSGDGNSMEMVEVPAGLSQEDRDLLTTHVTGGKAYTFRAMANALGQVRDKDASVVNISQGTGSIRWPNHYSAGASAQYAAYWKTFLERMEDKHPSVVFVASAGNEGEKNVGALDGTNRFPGGIPAPNLITVGAVDNDGNRASFSNYETAGAEVTIAAPGVKIPTGIGADGRTALSRGTSFSAPMVASAAALLKSINPNLSAAQVKQLLVETAAPAAPPPAGFVGPPVAVPDNLGGKMLRIDDAVLKAINDLRREADADAPLLTKDELLALASVRGTLQASGPLDFDVTATVDRVRENGGTPVTAELLGEGVLGGDSTVSMASAGDATWSLTMTAGTDPPTVRVCRTDVGACCNLVPEQQIEIAGIWSGTMTMTELILDEDQTLPDGSVVASGEYKGDELDQALDDCEARLGEAAEYAAALQALEDLRDGVPGTLEFTGTLLEPGTVVSLSEGPGGTAGSAVPWRAEGSSIVWEGVSEAGYTAFSGTISGTTMTGSWGFIPADATAEMRGVFTLTKAG